MPFNPDDYNNPFEAWYRYTYEVNKDYILDNTVLTKKSEEDADKRLYEEMHGITSDWE